MAEPKHMTGTEHVPASEHKGGFPPFQSQTFASQLALPADASAVALRSRRKRVL